MSVNFERVSNIMIMCCEMRPVSNLVGSNLYEKCNVEDNISLNSESHKQVEGINMQESDEKLFRGAANRVARKIETLMETNPLIRKSVLRITGQDGAVCENTSPELSDDTLPSLHGHYPNSIRFRGQKRFINYCCDLLSEVSGSSDHEECYRKICSYHEAIEEYMANKVIRPEHLTQETRNIRGWLAYFLQRENLDAYVRAVQIAQPIFEFAAQQSHGKYKTPVIVHFCPVKNLYWRYGYENCTQIKLRTPMISFNQEDFSLIANVIFHKKRNRREIAHRTTAESYQRIQTGINVLGNFYREQE